MNDRERLIQELRSKKQEEQPAREPDKSEYTFSLFLRKLDTYNSINTGYSNVIIDEEIPIPKDLAEKVIEFYVDNFAKLVEERNGLRKKIDGERARFLSKIDFDLERGWLYKSTKRRVPIEKLYKHGVSVDPSYY